MSTLIALVSEGVPAALTELRRLGRTLKYCSGTCWPTSPVPAPPTGRLSPDPPMLILVIVVREFAA